MGVMMATKQQDRIDARDSEALTGAERGPEGSERVERVAPIVGRVVRDAPAPGARSFGRVVREAPEPGDRSLGRAVRQATEPGVRSLGRVVREPAA
jgi:hypothetical protein